MFFFPWRKGNKVNSINLIESKTIISDRLLVGLIPLYKTYMTQLSPIFLIVWYIQRGCLSFKTNSFKLRKEIWKNFNQFKTVLSFIVIPTWGPPLCQWQIGNGECYYIEQNESILERGKLRSEIFLGGFRCYHSSGHVANERAGSRCDLQRPE